MFESTRIVAYSRTQIVNALHKRKEKRLKPTVQGQFWYQTDDNVLRRWVFKERNSPNVIVN